LKWDFHNTGTNLFLEAIASANGVYVIGGEERLCVSTNKTEWKELLFPDHTFFEIVHGKGLFVASATQGPWTVDTLGTGRAVGTNQIWISSEGVNWKKTYEEWTDVIQTVAYGNGVFIAAGGGGHLLVSTDGVNWSEQKVSFNTFKLSFAGNRFFSAGYPDTSSSPEALSIEARPAELRVYGPIGKTIKIYSTDAIGGAAVARDVPLLSTPTIIAPQSGFMFGVLE
jgi:hypothetical protein